MTLLKIHKNIDYEYQLWEIDTDLTKSKSAYKVFPEYHPNIRSYKNNFRINQILNTRRIIKEMADENVFLTQNIDGKPLLSNSNQHISITNHKNFIAVIIANYLCGIDLENYNRNLNEIKHKYLNSFDFPSNNNKDLSKIWCGKEVLFKINGNPQINFKKHLFVEKNNAGIIGRCEHDDISFDSNLSVINFQNLLLMFNTSFQEKITND